MLLKKADHYFVVSLCTLLHRMPVYMDPTLHNF